MGFSALAGLPPVYGLYSSFYCVIIYFLFGQSPHMSFGTMAIISIMLSDATSTDDQLESTAQGNQSHSPNIQNLSTTVMDEEVSARISRTLLVTLLSGVIMIALAICRLDRIVAFLPMPCTSGFTTAAAFHIVTNQLKNLLGIKLKSHKGVFKLVKLWREYALEILHTNICDLIIGLCCLVVLFVIKEIINVKFRHKLPVPIPGEILVLTVVTLISHFQALNQNYGIKILSDISAGFVAPSVPDFKEAQNVVVDALIIATISFVIAYSMVSMFARKNHYEIDIDQELMAYGLCHTIGAFFGAFAGSAAPPRCTVLDTTGAKTQFVHIFTSIVLVLTILFISPLFKPLPYSCLAAVIICALIPLFKQFSLLRLFWRVNKYDFAIWLVTWASVVFLDIDVGLAIGAGFSVATVAIQGFEAQGQILNTVGHQDLFQTSDRHELSDENTGIKIFRFNSGLHFASLRRFKEELYRLTKNPHKQKPAQTPTLDIAPNNSSKANTSVNKRSGKVHDGTNGYLQPKTFQDSGPVELKYIVIDCSSMIYIDTMGVGLIKQLQTDFRDAGINLVLANCSSLLLSTLNVAGLASPKEKDPDDSTKAFEVFPTVQDAVAFARQDLRNQRMVCVFDGPDAETLVITL